MSNNESHHCVICGEEVVKFIPYRGGTSCLPELMQLLDLVGSDVDNFLCPHCGSHDRERHLFLYMHNLNILNIFEDARVLHFAPEQWFSKIIELHKPRQYIKADLFPTSADIQQVNLLDTGFDDASFDVLIANHVLEHVDNDSDALKEIKRIVRPSGVVILQTPFSAKILHTIDDPGVDDDQSRLALYGQEDHVRLYGQDIFSRISSAGFSSMVVTHEEAMPEIDAACYGVNIKEPFFLFQREGI